MTSRSRRRLAIPRLGGLGLAATLLVAACSSGGSTPSSAAAPSPAVSAGARTIAIRMTDALRYEPSAITVKAGEAIHFVVTNAASTEHEFVIGDEAAQMRHAEGMMGGGMMHDEPDAITVPAGQNKELDFTFGEAGQSLIGCHVAGHYEAGMRMDVTIEP